MGVTVVSTVGVPKGELETHTCYRDSRGMLTHCDFYVDGRRYITFPGDYPEDQTTLYQIKTADDDGTLLIIHGKPADAHATDPVERFVFKGKEAELIEHTVLNDHSGNQAYWSMSPEARGTYVE